MVTYFQNSFTVGFCTKYATASLLCLPPHLKHVTIVPCKTSAVDTFNFQHVTNDVRSEMLMFIDPNGTYCYDMLPTEQLLPVMREISVEFLSPSKTVLLHAELVRQLAFWNGRRQLSFHQTCGSQKSRSNPDDHRIWAEMQQQLYQTRKFIMLMNWSSMCSLVRDMEKASSILQMSLCQGRTFKHLIWLKSTLMLNLIFWFC